MVEPKRRKKCAGPGCSKPPVRMPKHLAKSRRTEDYERDPFCSSVCCRAYYAVADSEPSGPGVRTTYTSD